ncbi:MAG TPA: DUF2231 domain-containing protein, partial [Thermoanaerobaculia bacterium]
RVIRMRPIHRTLIVFPLGLLGTSFFFDLAWLTWNRAPLAVTARWLILAGVTGGVVASIFGFLDWLRIPQGTRARRIGALHGSGNLIVATLFAASWFLRPDAAHPSALAIAVSAAGVILSVMTGWLGGELVSPSGAEENALGPPTVAPRPAGGERVPRSGG